MSEVKRAMERAGFWFDPDERVYKRGQLRVTEDQARVALDAAQRGVYLGAEDFSPRGIGRVN